MGANESTSSHGINDSAFLPVTDCDSYDILKQSENPAYGQFIIARNRQSQKKFAVIEIVCSNENELQSLLKSTQEKFSYSCQSLIQVYSAHNQTNSEYCGQFQRLLVKIEYIPRSLKDLIASRQKMKSIFSERDIISMIESAVIGLDYLQTKGIIHGQINPACILVDTRDPNSLIFKLTDVDLLKKTVQTDYQQFYHGTISEDQGCYLSPKLLYSLLHRMIIPSHDAEKTNVFAVGLCALQMAIQCTKTSDINYIFDLNEFEIIPRRLKAHLGKVSVSYSESLRMLIGRMVRLDEARRVDYKNILMEIENYKQGIMVICDPSEKVLGNSQETTNIEVKSEKEIDLEESSRVVKNLEYKKLQSQQQTNSQQSQQQPKVNCSLLTLSGNVLDSQEIIPQSSQKYLDLQAVVSPVCFQMDSRLSFSVDDLLKNQETRESTSSISSKGSSLFTMPKRRNNMSKYSPIRIIYAAMNPVENLDSSGFKDIGNQRGQIGQQMTQYQQENEFKGMYSNNSFMQSDRIKDQQKYLSPLRQQNTNLIKHSNANNSQPNPKRNNIIDIGQLSKSSVKIDLGKKLLESKNEQRNVSITERTQYQDLCLIQNHNKTNIVSPSVILQSIQLQHPQHHFF